MTTAFSGRKRRSSNHDGLRENKDNKSEGSKIVRRSSNRLVTKGVPSEKHQPKITDVFKVLLKKEL